MTWLFCVQSATMAITARHTL